jgi:hypothetical protein
MPFLWRRMGYELIRQSETSLNTLRYGSGVHSERQTALDLGWNDWREGFPKPFCANSEPAQQFSVPIGSPEQPIFRVHGQV